MRTHPLPIASNLSKKVDQFGRASCRSFIDGEVARTLEGDRLERLVDQVRPDLVEHVWAEPFNDRVNWRAVRDGYDPASHGYEWLTEVCERGNKAVRSRCATEIYTRLRAKAEREGWLPKLKYLLHPGDITAADAPAFAGLKGVLLPSTPNDEGQTKNRHIAAVA